MTTETPQEAATLAGRLAEARSQRGWSLREAERRTGVSNAHLSQLETGTILRPSLDTLVPLAAVYGLPLDELAALAGHDVEAIRELSGAGVRVTMITAGEPGSALPPPVTDYGPVRLELMGHRYREGRLSEVVIAGVPFLRLDLAGGAAEYYRPDAVYCISPATAPVPVAAIPARFDYALDDGDPDVWDSGDEGGDELPEEWVKAAKGWYSMHGAGLTRNLLAGAVPLIRAAERERAERAEARLAEIAGHVRDRLNAPGRSGMSRAAAGIILGLAEGSSEEGNRGRD